MSRTYSIPDNYRIEPEHYSPEERAADRAERFGDYRDKRASEAGGHADRFEAGPQAFGHQNAVRAERQATRHDRHRGRAVSQWSKAEYWQRRTEGVISSALYKALPKVRRSRILRLEAEQRKHEKSRAEYAERFAKWQAVLMMEGADSPVVEAETPHYGINTQASTPAAIAAYVLANTPGCYGDYEHPRKDVKASLYSLMTRHEDPITAREAAELFLGGRTEPFEENGSSIRWSRHYENRLAFERAMLANEGGTAADADMEPGGWIGKNQIHAVNRSPVTGAVVSVKLMIDDPHRVYDPVKGERWETRRRLKSFNIQRMPEGVYRAPTVEERDAFAQEKKERKAKEKETKPAAPSLINPTDEDAERLQALWNAKAKERHDKCEGARYMSAYRPSAVYRMTQKQYSAASGGSYSHLETVNVCEHGRRPKREYGQEIDPSPILFKIRKAYGGTGMTSSADRVIIITDKPQKPLPLDWQKIEAQDKPAPLPVVIVPEQPAEEKEIAFTAGNLFGGIS